jgi:hypothetical protein
MRNAANFWWGGPPGLQADPLVGSGSDWKNRPARGPAADEGVRPTSVDRPLLEKFAALRAHARATNTASSTERLWLCPEYYNMAQG